MVGEHAIGKAVLGGGHLGDLEGVGARSKPVDEVLVVGTLDVDHVVGLGEEFAVFTWVSDLGEGVAIGLDEVHSLGDISHVSEFVEHEVLGLDLLLSDGGHVLVGRGAVGHGSSAEILLEGGVEAVKEGLESGVLGALWDTGDLAASDFVVALDEVLGDLHAGVLLLSAGIFSLPDHDSVVELKDVGIGVDEVSTGERSGGDFSSDNSTTVVRDVPELVSHTLIFGASRGLVGDGGSDGSGSSTKGSPEGVLTGLVDLLNEVELGLCLAVVLLDSLGDLTALGSLEHVGLGAEPAVKLEAEIQDEAVTLVQRGSVDRDGEDTGVSLSLAVKEARLIALGFDVAETTLDTAFKIEETSLEVAHEHISLVTLFFQMMS